MISPSVFLAVYVLDWLIGDPQWLPHPVRVVGTCIARAEILIRRWRATPSGEYVTGAGLSVCIIVGSVAVAWGVVRFANFLHPIIGVISLAYLAVTTLATRCLIDEVSSVERCLQQRDIVGARRQLSRIVGRDVDCLDEAEIIRAAIETLAESASDGIVAPMFYLGVGGVSFAIGYKSVNTLDSMIGHNNVQYRYFGKFAARLDDVANFIPARLTAILFVITAFVWGNDWRGAVRIWRRDGDKHASPNAGRPEAAMAGALQIQLGGLNFYDGEPHDGKRLGDAENPLDLFALRQAKRLTATVSLLMFFLTLTFLVKSHGTIF